MELKRRHLLAGGTVVAGGVLFGSAVWDDHLLCPEPAEYEWEFHDEAFLSPMGRSWTPPVLGDDAVFVGRGHGIIAGASGIVGAVDRERGTTRWSVEWEPAGVGTPALDDDVLYVPTGRNELLALAASDGERRWRVDAGVDPIAPGESFALARPVASDDGVVVQAFEGPTADGFDGDHAVAGVDGTSGDLAWTRTLPARARPVALEDGVAVVAKDGSIVSLDAATGDVEGRTAVDATVTDVESSDEGEKLTLLDDTGTLIGIDLRDGGAEWRASPGPPPGELAEHVSPVPSVAVGEELVLAGTVDGEVVGYEARFGNRRFVYDAGAPVVSVNVPVPRWRAVAVDARGFVHRLSLPDGDLQNRFATVDGNHGDTCGARIERDWLPDAHVAVGEDAYYLAFDELRRFEPAT